jgi:hypothetical protein
MGASALDSYQTLVFFQISGMYIYVNTLYIQYIGARSR